MLIERGLKVTQQGIDAKVLYDQDGMPILVNLPQIPDDADEAFISAMRGFIDHECAHVLETDGPVMVAAVRKNPKIRNLLNVIEDVRIERAMRRRFPGSAGHLEDLWGFVSERSILPAAQKAANERELFGALLPTILHAWSGKRASQELMDKHHLWPAVEKLTRVLEPLREGLADGALKSSEDAILLAERMLKALQEAEQPEKPKPPPMQEGDEGEKDEGQSGEPDDSGDRSEPSEGEGAAGSEGSENEGAGEDERSQDERSQDERSQDERSQDERSQDEGDEQDRGSEDEGEGSEDEGEGSEDEGEGSEDEGEGSEGEASRENDQRSEGAGEDERSQDEGDEQDEQDRGSGDDGDGQGAEGDDRGQDDSSDSSEGLGGGESDPAEEAREGEGDSSDDPAGESAVEGALIDSTDFLDEMRQLEDHAVEALRKGVLHALTDAAYIPYTTDWDTWVTLNPHPGTESAVEREAAKMDEQTRAMVGQLANQFRRLFAQKEISVPIGGLRAGRLHAPALHRLMAGDDRVFFRREEHNATDTAVTLLVDCSGSMNGHGKMDLALIAANAFSQTLDLVRIAHSVCGFTTRSDMDDHYIGMFHPRSRKTPLLTDKVREEIGAQQDKMGRQFSRIEPIAMLRFKGFEESYRVARPRFAAMRQSLGDHRAYPMVSNVDGESVQYAARELLVRREKRKVMIVFSDGYPAAMAQASHLQSHLVETVKRLEKAGVEMLGIGILSDAVRRYYSKHVVLTNAAELPTTTMRELTRMLLR
jgi:Mg-chelatase subunit ChlD